MPRAQAIGIYLMNLWLTRLMHHSGIRTGFTATVSYASQSPGVNSGTKGLTKRTPSIDAPVLKSSLNTIGMCAERAAAQIWAS